MDWFKHFTTSHDDPDISDAIDLFGHSAYSTFFIILELYGDEYNHLDSSGWLRLSKRFVARKLRISLTKVEKILNFYSERQRILVKTNGQFVLIKCPKFIDISSNWTKRKYSKTTEDLCRDSVVPTAPRIEEEEEKEKETYSSTSDEVRLSELLFEKIKERDVKAKEPDLQKWGVHIDRLIRIDKRTPQEIEEIIIASQKDSFWQSNILSTKKLREKFSQLVQKFKLTQSEDKYAGIYRK